MMSLPSARLMTAAKLNIAQAPTNNDYITGTLQGNKADTASHQVINPSVNDLKRFLYDVAVQNGLDYEKMEATIQCESRFQADPPHNNQSRGVAQFMLDTWLGYCSDKDDRTNPYKSLSCMGKMWKNGLSYQWDCYCYNFYDKNCIEKRGLYPL